MGQAKPRPELRRNQRVFWGTKTWPVTFLEDPRGPEMYSRTQGGPALPKSLFEDPRWTGEFSLDLYDI